MYYASLLVVLVSILGAYNLNLLPHNQPSSVLAATSDISNYPLATMTNNSGPRLRILTQNMFMRPPLIKNNKSDWKDERLDYFIEHILDNYDVICLQEMFEFASSRRSRLFAAAEKLGFKFYVASQRQFPWNLAIDGGLVLLSRYPVVASDSFEYQRGIGPDWLAKKGVLYAKIAISKDDSNGALTHVHMFTTHTQASYGEVVITQPDVKRRLSQLFEFHNFMERVLPQHRAAGEAVLLTGDFNVDSRDHVLSDPSHVKHEREVEDGVETSDEGRAMMAILEGQGIDPKVLGPDNTDEFRGKITYVLHDALKERLGYHPVTFGNIIVDNKGAVLPRETVLTTKLDSEVMHSIDYVLWHNPDTADQKHGIIAELVDVGVVPNFTPDREFTQISDHYGVAAQVVFAFP